jgi:hypothetical protein
LVYRVRVSDRIRVLGSHEARLVPSVRPRVLLQE